MNDICGLLMGHIPLVHLAVGHFNICTQTDAEYEVNVMEGNIWIHSEVNKNL